MADLQSAEAEAGTRDTATMRIGTETQATTSPARRTEDRAGEQNNKKMKKMAQARRVDLRM